MKKIMIAAALAAMTVGAFADACSDAPDLTQCRAWDLTLKLKTVCPKKAKCGKDACGENVGDVYFLEKCTRSLKGYLWVCDYTCAEPFNIVLWDKKNKRGVIVYDPSGAQTIEANSENPFIVYGKKAKYVAGALDISGNDITGEEAINVVAAGVGGKLSRNDDSEGCYIKSLSGYAAGKLAFIKKADFGSTTVSTLCGEEVIESECDELVVKGLDLCGACCWTTWCSDDSEEADVMQPACGTWKMKYNKKVSKGTKSMASLVPAYAL